MLTFLITFCDDFEKFLIAEILKHFWRLENEKNVIKCKYCLKYAGIINKIYNGFERILGIFRVKVGKIRRTSQRNFEENISNYE